jgi:choline/glycine/proline betaine transport protein
MLGTLTIPFSYIVMWVSIFGNSAVKQIADGDKAFGELATSAPEQGFYSLLQQYPGAWFLVGLATFVGLLFYVTSADSGALVMANLSSDLPDSETDASPWLRIGWAAATGVLTIAMLLVGGIVALQYATIVMGLPFAVVMVLVMIGLYKALEAERTQVSAARLSLTSHLAGRESGHQGSWRRRVATTFGTVSLKRANERLTSVVVPALHEVAEAMESEGRTARVEVGDGGATVPGSARLVVGKGPAPFTWSVRAHRVAAPSYGTRMIEADDRTTRLEVALPTGGGYDVFGYSAEEVCHDVLDHFERWSSAEVLAEHP